jgi:hypothetical protein
MVYFTCKSVITNMKTVSDFVNAPANGTCESRIQESDFQFGSESVTIWSDHSFISYMSIFDLNSLTF